MKPGARKRAPGKAVANELAGGAERHDRELPLHVREGSSEGEQLFDPAGTQSRAVELGFCIVRRDVVVEVDRLGNRLDDAPSVDRETLGRDVGVAPVVLAHRDHLLESHSVYSIICQ